MMVNVLMLVLIVIVLPAYVRIQEQEMDNLQLTKFVSIAGVQHYRVPQLGNVMELEIVMVHFMIILAHIFHQRLAKTAVM